MDLVTLCRYGHSVRSQRSISSILGLCEVRDAWIVGRAESHI